MKTGLAALVALFILPQTASAADMPVRKLAGERAGTVERKKPKAEGNEKLFMDFLRWQKGKQQPRQ
jgi:hypothetical protein